MSQSQEHTVAYKLFHYTFVCMIPTAFAVSSLQQITGTRIHANSKQDASAAEEMLRQQLTIVQMAQLHHKGARIIVVNPVDTVKIYRLIKDHLDSFKLQMDFSLNPGKIPLDDLRILDNFAEVVYRVARQHEPVDQREGKFARSLRDLSQTRLTPRVEKTTQSNVEVKAREHNSITADIDRAALKRSLPRR